MNNQEYCKWSLNRCWNRNESLQSETIESSSDMCPSFNAGSTSKLLIPFTTSSRQQAPLTMELLNINSNSNLVCMITFFKTLNLYQNLTTKVKIVNDTHIQCILDDLFQLNDLFTSGNGKLETNLRVYDTSMDYFLDSKIFSVEFIFYKCEILANTCDQCSQIKPFYSCGWCLNSFSRQECKFIPVNVNRIPILKKLYIDTQKCKLFNESDSSTCSAISFTYDENVLSVKPQRLPLAGGTLISLNGIKYADSVTNVSICGQNCEIKEIFSTQIKCLAKSNAYEQECAINLIYTNSKVEVLALKVEYVDVKVDSIKPNELIQFCKGCVIEIHGKNLDAGLNRRIRILDSSSLRSQMDLDLAQQQRQLLDFNEEI